MYTIQKIKMYKNCINIHFYTREICKKSPGLKRVSLVF